MTYQYAMLAVGIKKHLREADYTVPCDLNGTVLETRGDVDELIRYGTKKVVRYEIKNNVMYCYLNVQS